MSRGADLDPSRRRWPVDLVAVLALTAAANVVVLAPVLRETPLRIPFGLAMAFLVPGYAIVAAAFPSGSGVGEPDGRCESERRPITGTERGALATVVSALLTALVGIGLSLVGIDLTLLPILGTLTAVTGGATVVAGVRRRRLPPDERLAIAGPSTLGLESPRPGTSESGSRGDRLLDGLLVAVVLLAVVGVAYTAVAPAGDDGYTELALLTETENGTLEMGGYPETVAAGESHDFTLQVRNREGKPIDYALVSQLQYPARSDGRTAREAWNGTGEAAARIEIEERLELDRFEHRLRADENWTRSHAMSVPPSNEDVRLVYLLYAGDVPDEPTIENADEAVYLWLTVAE